MVPRKIKILHVVNSLDVGGMENILINLINHMDENKFEHTVCCIARRGAMGDRIKKNVVIHEMKKGNNADYILPLKIACVIRKENPDIVHTRNWSAIDGIIASAFAKKRKVIHDEHGRCSSDPKGLDVKRKWMRKILDRYVDRYVVVSDELQDWMNKFIGIQSDKIVRIQNSVDTTIFSPTEDKACAKIAIGLPSNSLVVGYVGRLDPVKNLDLLIKSFSTLVTSVISKKPVLLIIIGSGPEEKKMRHTAKLYHIDKQVMFMGEHSNVHEFMHAMDIFAISSIAEGIPLTVLEAMASGLPVVATRVGGISEVVQDGKSGYLLDSGDDHAFSEKFRKYISDESLRTVHGRKGRELVEERYSLEKMIRQYENLYMEVVCEGKSN
jgi:sugar transferase (PEP-CTERM/EpsH1 system associated)